MLNIIEPGTEISVDGVLHIIVEADQKLDRDGNLTRATLVMVPKGDKPLSRRPINVHATLVPSTEAEY